MIITLLIVVLLGLLLIKFTKFILRFLLLIGIIVALLMLVMNQDTVTEFLRALWR